MLEDLTALQMAAAHLRARIRQARRDETGAISLEWVAVIIGILTVASIVTAIVIQRAGDAANRIVIP
jgi:hypothetical protein